MNINTLFKKASENGASDLHIIVGRPPILRIDGELKIIDGATEITRDAAEQMIFSILTEKQKQSLLKKEN